MGLHSLINQDQYHASLSDKNNKADPNIGWDGITKVGEDNVKDTQVLRVLSACFWASRIRTH